MARRCCPSRLREQTASAEAGIEYRKVEVSMNRLSPIHWLGLCVGAMIVALFVFNDNGPLPIFKPRMAEAYVAPLESDTEVLRKFALPLRRMALTLSPTDARAAEPACGHEPSAS